MGTAKQKTLKLTPSVKAEIVKFIEEKLKLTQIKEIKELRIVISELAEAQKRTEQRVEELAEAQRRTEERVNELAEAQKETQKEVSRLDRALQELAEAQKRTEQKVEELADAQKKTELEVANLTRSLNNLRSDFGGFSRTMSYAFENEAFRMLPGFLKERFGIEITERLIREEIGGKEINIFGKARKNGKEIYIVGESKLRLDERREESIEEVFEELEEKVKAVKEEYGDVEVLCLLITHYATKGFKKGAEDRGVIVVQSFEW